MMNNEFLNTLFSRPDLVNTLEDALTRQIAQPVVIEGWYGAYECPRCHHILSNGNYCRWCGQRIQFPTEGNIL